MHELKIQLYLHMIEDNKRRHVSSEAVAMLVDQVIRVHNGVLVLRETVRETLRCELQTNKFHQDIVFRALTNLWKKLEPKQVLAGLQTKVADVKET